MATDAQSEDWVRTPGELKQLSLEELMNQTVVSVSRQAEALSDAPAAVTVITQEDIRRSGATSLPEALRLAPNLEVAQVSSHEWAVSARGFNNTAANKMLVMIDGRTVYTPLFAGVFSFQGDYYQGGVAQPQAPHIDLSGGNSLGRWIHSFSEESDLTVQMYYDQTHRRIPNTFTEDLAACATRRVWAARQPL